MLGELYGRIDGLWTAERADRPAGETGVICGVGKTYGGGGGPILSFPELKVNKKKF